MINKYKFERDWCDSVWKTKYYIEIEASEFLVTRGRHTFKKDKRNFAFLESVTRQVSSLPVFVDWNEVRKNFVCILYAWNGSFPGV